MRHKRYSCARLPGFRNSTSGASSETSVYRIAVNYILDAKKSAVERMHLTFEQFADDLADGLRQPGLPTPSAPC